MKMCLGFLVACVLAVGILSAAEPAPKCQCKECKCSLESNCGCLKETADKCECGDNCKCTKEGPCPDCKCGVNCKCAG